MCIFFFFLCHDVFVVVVMSIVVFVNELKLNQTLNLHRIDKEENEAIGHASSIGIIASFHLNGINSN